MRHVRKLLKQKDIGKNMVHFDSKIPSKLLSIQQWFASIITRPIDADSQMQPIAPSGRPLSEEAMEIIAPSLTLTSDKRIQIYNQQYWWRLLSILHQNFPLLTRLFGYNDFNISIGMPFLTKHPSYHWSISKLGDQLPSWLEEHYTAQDKTLILLSAQIDWAYQDLFFAPPPVNQDSSHDLLPKKMRLQKHVKLFALPFDLFSFRNAFLRESVEYWTESDFPLLPKEKKYFFLLYRHQKNSVLYKEIQEGHWIFLHSIENGSTMEEACAHLEKLGGSVYEEACSFLQEWTRECMQENWLVLEENV
jgi:Putative DNA-binding domain